MSCSTVNLIPGPQGPSGANGTNGTNGVDAFTSLTAGFTMPAEGANATATVASTAMLASGETVFLQGCGFLQVQVVVNSTQVTLQNLRNAATLAYQSNVAPGVVIAAGALLVPGGIQGPASSSFYALYQHVLADGTSAGDFSSGAWRTVPLNTEQIDTGSVGTIAANQVSLIAGTYRCRWRSYGYQVDGFQSRLWNVTDAALIALGSVAKAAAADTTMAVSIGETRFTLAAAKTIEIDAKCTTTKLASGFGIAASMGLGEVYASLELSKEI